MDKVKRSHLLHFSSRKATAFVIQLFFYVLLVSLAFVFLFPFLYMLITSVKSYSDLIDTSVEWIVNEIHFRNYILSWKELNYPLHLFNSTIVTILSTMGHLLSCAMAGYAFARYSYRYTNRLFLLVIATMVIPIQTLIVPMYIIFVKIGIIDTFLPLILPTFLGSGLKSGLFIFIFRQFFLTLPRSLEEAAEIDGCNCVKTYVRIALPSASNSILVCAVLSVVWHYNDYYEPSLYLRKSELYLLPQVLPNVANLLDQISTGGGNAALTATLNEDYHLGLIMASCVLVLLPLMIFYFIVQRWFMQGIENSGITGEWHC